MKDMKQYEKGKLQKYRWRHFAFAIHIVRATCVCSSAEWFSGYYFSPAECENVNAVRTPTHTHNTHNASAWGMLGMWFGFFFFKIFHHLSFTFIHGMVINLFVCCSR